MVGAEALTVIANSGDDVEAYGIHVSPDPDLVTYWLADVIDGRGYGIEGDTWEVMGALEAAGRPAWFRLGDRDLALCLIRTELLRAGTRITEAQAAVGRALGVEAPVLPMSDEPVRTEVRARGRWLPFQEYMILERAAAPVDGVAFRGADAARPTAEVLRALAGADAIVIGPSNPVASIRPILAVPGMSEAIAGAAAPVVAVSPFVGGRSVKGPSELFCAHAGIALSATGVAGAYERLLDGLVADEPAETVPTLETDTLMDSADARRRLAESILEFAGSLRS